MQDYDYLSFCVTNVDRSKCEHHFSGYSSFGLQGYMVLEDACYCVFDDGRMNCIGGGSKYNNHGADLWGKGLIVSTNPRYNAVCYRLSR